MAELPEDLMTEIALRLPVKSVGRFRCVSKRWNVFLSSLEFVVSYQHESIILMDSSTRGSANPTPHVITPATGTGAGSSRPVSSQLLKDCRVTGLVGCCNGLALLSVGSRPAGLMVINLVTSRATRIAKPVLKFGLEILGLGYSSVDDDYKVVVLSAKQTASKCGVEIYSLTKTRAWRKLDDSPYLHLPHHTPVYADGHLCWLASEDGFAAFVIAAFDLSAEKFVDPVPAPITIEFDMDLNLAVMGGCLALVDCSTSTFEDINVWIMEKPAGSWTNFTILNNKPQRSINCVVCMLGEFEFVLAVDDRTELVAYNCQTKVWRDLNIHGLSFFPGEILSFRESLSYIDAI